MIVELTPPPSTADEHSRRDELAERLRWLINLRWMALGGVCVAVLAARQLQLVASTLPLVAITLTMALLNLGFHGLHMRLPVRTLHALSSEALLQITVDVVGLGLLVFFAGGLSNPFIFYLSFHVVIAAILLEKRQAYGVALLSAAMVCVLGLAEEFHIVIPPPLQGELAEPRFSTLARFEMVFALSTTLIISVYMVTAIMDRLRARTQDVRRLNRDLAERVDMLASAEKKLAAEHQRARAILECMEEGVVVVDLQGKVLLANTAAQHSALMALEHTLRSAGCHEKPQTPTQAGEAPALSPSNGYCHGPLAGENLLQHHHDHPPAAAAGGNAQKDRPAEEIAKDSCPMGNPAACLQEALEKGGNLCPATLALLGADPPEPQAPVAALTPPKSPTLAQIELQGRRFENTVSAVRTSSNETMGLVIVSRDVTERRSLERQVVHAEKLHALGNLAAGVAHELNTPLGTILGYAQMMLEDEQKAPTRKELKAIEDQARRCRKIVQSLLDFARKSSGGREECSPNDLAARIRDLIAHAMEMRGIALKLDLAPHSPSKAPPKVLVAVNEIEQVLVNLVTNAADAIEMSGAKSRDGCVTIQTRHESNGEVLIAVEDNGPGVSKEIADQIFEPFFTTKAAGKGTGLGLSIARRIVEDHNGTLVLKARADGQAGARFELRLKTRVPALVPA